MTARVFLVRELGSAGAAAANRVWAAGVGRWARMARLAGWLSLLLPALTMGSLAVESGPRPRPNILLILADDLGYGDVGCYNPESKVPTPNLDRLARNGLRFTDAHSASTVCTPSRYGILTGRMGFRANSWSVFEGVGGPCLIEPERLTLPQMLRARGYATAMTGKWHLGLTFQDHEGRRITERGVAGVKLIDYGRSIPDAPIHRGFDRFFGTACCPTTDYLYAFIDGDRILNPFPIVHVGSLGGMVMPWLMQRGILYQHHPFSMDIFLRQIEEEGITYTVAPPAVLNMLLKSDALAKANISTLRSVGSGSAPLAPWMVKGFQEQYGIAIFNTFGSTEGLALMGGHGDVPDPVRRATYFPRYGRPEFTWANRGAASQETKLIDPATGREILEPNVPGELCTKGAYVFPCYYKNPEKTAETIDADGFYHSGDTFEIAGPGDDFRYYRYVGRTKDIIIRGGLNISPAELESLIDGHPKLREAAVIGYPDEIMGEKVCVVAATQPGQNIDLREIIDWLKGKHVAVYKLPEKLIVVDALPRNAIGKVLKRDMKALL